MILPDLTEIQAELKSLDEILLDALLSENPLLTVTSTHLVKAGGKRIRPAFALLASKFGNCSKEELQPLMVILEMIHLSSLIHDDVLDKAQFRRGVPTVNAQWGEALAVITGDYIFAKSMVIATIYKDKRIPNILINLSREMIKGELYQHANLFNINQSIRDYLYRIKRKTALLISVSGQLGAMVANAPDWVVDSLKKYGYYLGMAFQITDDILDFTSEERELGKTLGNDLKQGILNLPTLYALNSKPEGDRLKELILKRFNNYYDFEEAIKLIKSSDSFAKSSRLAESYVRKAKKWLTNLPPIPTKSLLFSLADLVISRKF